MLLLAAEPPAARPPRGCGQREEDGIGLHQVAANPKEPQLPWLPTQQGVTTSLRTSLPSSPGCLCCRAGQGAQAAGGLQAVGPRHHHCRRPCQAPAAAAQHAAAPRRCCHRLGLHKHQSGGACGPQGRGERRAPRRPPLASRAAVECKRPEIAEFLKFSGGGMQGRSGAAARRCC